MRKKPNPENAREPDLPNYAAALAAQKAAQVGDRDQELEYRVARCVSRVTMYVAHQMGVQPADAEDAAQDLCVRLLVGGRQPKEWSSPDAWLRRVVRNALVSLLRRHRPLAAVMSLSDMSDNIAAPENKGAGLRETVAELLAQLRPGYRDAIQRRYLDGQSFDEIARELGVEVATVKSRLQRARDAVRAIRSA